VANRALALIVAGFVLAVAARGTAEGPAVLPLPMVDVPPGPTTSAVAVLAGGCFWGVQGVFQHGQGATSAVSGYAGGAQRTAHYDIVSFGGSGHAESVQITYDPRQISYGRLLQIFFSVVHDPTEVNRQGPDDGPQYRSAIFSQSDEQARVAAAYIAQLDAAHLFRKRIATKVEVDRPFYPAEAYHQDFLVRHPTYPYIVYNDLGKIENLKRTFPELYRATPVLVADAQRSR